MRMRGVAMDSTVVTAPEINDIVDSAFEAMCVALGRRSGTDSGDAGAAAAVIVPTDSVPTALDFGADTTESYLTGVATAGSTKVVDDDAVEQSMAAAAACVAHTESFGGVLGPELSPRARKMAQKRARKAADNAGAKWYNMAAGSTDPEAETTLKLLKLRKYFDPKHFIKSDASKKPPK